MFLMPPCQRLGVKWTLSLSGQLSPIHAKFQPTVIYCKQTNCSFSACPKRPINPHPDTDAHTRWHPDEPSHALCVCRAVMLTTSALSRIHRGACGLLLRRDRGADGVMKDAKRVSDEIGEERVNGTWLFLFICLSTFPPVCSLPIFLTVSSGLFHPIVRLVCGFAPQLMSDFAVWMWMCSCLSTGWKISDGFSLLIIPKVLVHFLHFFP